MKILLKAWIAICPEIIGVPSDLYRKLLAARSKKRFNIWRDTRWITKRARIYHSFNWRKWLYPMAYTDKRIKVDQYITQSMSTFKKISMKASLYSMKSVSIKDTISSSKTTDNMQIHLFTTILQPSRWEEPNNGCWCRKTIFGETIFDGRKKFFPQNTQLSISYIKFST